MNLYTYTSSPPHIFTKMIYTDIILKGKYHLNYIMYFWENGEYYYMTNCTLKITHSLATEGRQTAKAHTDAHYQQADGFMISFR